MKRWLVGYKIHWKNLVGWYSDVVHAETELDARHKFASNEIIYFIEEI